jgi:hypothetical protein
MLFMSGCTGLKPASDRSALQASGASGALDPGGVGDAGHGSVAGASGMGGAGAGGLGAAGAPAPSAGNGAAGAGGLAAAGSGIAAGSSAPPSITDPVIATVNTSCAREPAKACAGHDSVETLVCSAGKWVSGGACDGNKRCDTTRGTTLGTCQDMAALCIGKAPEDDVCDGATRRRCDPDLLRYEPHGCAANQHCDATGVVTCSCDSGYADDGAAGCTNIDECMQANVCNEHYRCQQLASPGYFCLGQFAQWPMPDSVAGAQTAPSYATTTDTVTDNVTHLVWQRNLPATYPGCSGNSSVAGDTCSWAEAKNYCASAALATSLGVGGWRLPTKIELESILDQTTSNPAIDSSAFPGTPSAVFWTASPYVDAGELAWYVDFNLGGSYYRASSDTYLVRCVR